MHKIMTIIIGGIAEGMKSTWASLATIIVAIAAATRDGAVADETAPGAQLIQALGGKWYLPSLPFSTRCR